MTESQFEALYTEDLFLIRPRVTVVITTPWAKVTSEERLKLADILKAVRLSLDGVNIIEQKELDLGVFVEKPHKLIYFGPNVTGLAKYELIQTQNTSLVLSDSLPELLRDEASRKKLWGALKQLFAL